MQQQPAQQAPSLFGGAGGLGGGGLFSQQGQQQQQGQSLFGQQQQQNQVPSSPYVTQLPVPNAGASFPRHHQSHVSHFSAMRAFRATFRDPASALATFPSRPQRHERRGYNPRGRDIWCKATIPRIKKQSSYPDENTAVVECRRIWINLRTTHMKSRNRKVVQFKTGSEGRILLRMVGCSSQRRSLYSSSYEHLDW